MFNNDEDSVLDSFNGRFDDNNGEEERESTHQPQPHRSSIGGGGLFSNMGGASSTSSSIVDAVAIKTSFSLFLQNYVFPSQQITESIDLTNTFRLDAALLKRHDAKLYNIL